MSVRILIVEDSAALRADLRSLLEPEPGLEVVGEAGTARELLPLADDLCPDVILLDMDLPELRGLAAVRSLGEALPRSHILLLTHYIDPGLGRDLLLAGAAGCVLSRAAGATLAVAVRAVAQGALYIERALVAALLAELRAPPPLCAGLTPAEARVLRLIARGLSNRQAAETLGLSVQSVERQRAQLMERLGLRSRADLVRCAAGLGPAGPASGPGDQ